MSPQSSPGRVTLPAGAHGSAAGGEPDPCPTPRCELHHGHDGDHEIPGPPRPLSTVVRTVNLLLDIERAAPGDHPHAIALRYMTRGLVTTLRQHPMLAERWEYDAAAVLDALEGRS